MSITADPTTGEAPVTVNFTASATDSDGTIASHKWQFGDGATSQAANPSHTYAEAGSYNAVLTVTDDDGATATATKTIVVSAPPKNTPPSVTVSADPTTGPAPLAVNFRCAASDSDGRIVSYLWKFGDGGRSNNSQASHQYKSKGKYTASVTVTDDQGAQTTRTIGILAEETPSDQDSDQDGLTDAQEEANGLDPYLPDSDADGLSDFIEWGPAETPADTDADGTIDALDSDSDGDGDSDAIEGTGDADGDGAPNYADSDDSDGPLGDQDGDGVNNSTEVTYMMNPNVPDSDGDGISDGVEFGSNTEPADSDGDGVPDALDLDSDGDGKSDSDEGIADDDGDGAPNFRDANDNDGPFVDLDQDGLSNVRETELGLNPNLADSDGDGIDDMVEVQDPNAPVDTDGDGTIDALDTDSDGDGVPDGTESREDFDGNGHIDRLDPTTATVVGHKGMRMALKVLTDGARLSDTKFVKDPVPDLLWSIIKQFRLGGLSFEVRNLPVGGSATVQILIERRFAPGTRYWKYDPVVGYYTIPCAVSGNGLTLELVDGGIGDVHPIPDGTIVDPGFIEEPVETTSEPQPSVSSSGAGGCSLAREPGSLADALSFLLPVLLVWIVKRRRSLM